MKKITLLMSFLMLLSWQGYAQVLTESFDGVTYPPTGWLNTQVSGTGLWNRVTTGTNPTITTHSGAGMSRYNCYSFSTGASADLSTVVVDLSVGGPYQVSFWMYRDNGYSTNTDRVAIYVNTTQASATGTLLGTINRSTALAPIESANGWYKYTFAIPGTFNTNTNYIIFKATSGYGNNIFLDDVSVELAPACPAPTALTATNILTTAVDLAWTEMGSATTWDIEYGATPFTPTGVPTITGTTTNPHNINTLTAQTSYAYYVRADCGVDSSAWVGPFTFTTACNPFAVPFVENFNSTSPTENCWTVINNNNDADLWDMNYTSVPLNGDQAAMMYTDYNAGANDDYLVTPTITLTGNERLRFHYRAQSSGEPNDFQVTLSTTGIGVGNFTNTLMPLTVVSNTTYQEQIINLSAYTGNVNIAFHVPAGGLDGYRLHIDSVVVEANPACPDPIALTATNILTTSADLAWTEMGSATTWDIEYGATPFTPTGVPTITGTTTNPHNINTLTANTAYAYYVRADCGVDSSAWVGPFTFTTACNPFTVPFVENFNSTSPTENCWTVIDNNNDADFWNMNYTSTPLNGDQVAIMYTDGNSGANDDYLVTPTLTLTGNERLRFHYKVQSSGEPNDFQVTLSTTGIGVGNFTNTLMPLTVVSNTTYQEQTINLSAYTGNVNIAFHIPAGGLDGWRLYIDSVVVEANPACPDPIALTATNITATTADLAWTEMGSATTWDIEYGATPFTPTGVPTITGTTTNPHNINTLTANTTYEYYVRADCGVDSSAWVGPYSFTTACNTINTFPFLEDFEAVSTTRSCWSQIQEIGTANWIFATGSSGGAITTAYSGTENARFVSVSGSNSPITKLVSPVFDLTSVAMPEIAFFYGQELWFSDQNELKVYYRTSTVSAWVQLAHYTSNIAVWTADTLTLPNPSATYQIAFEGINNYGRANVVDDFELYDAVSCSAPSNLTAFNIQPTSAILDWTENGTATNWNIEWDITGFILGTGTPQAVAAKPYLLQGLTPMTTYDYYVQADCGNDSSTWVGPYTFSTPACMPIGLDLGADTTLCPDDTLTLDAGAGSYLYNWSTGAITQQINVDTNSLGGNGTYTITVTVIDLITGCTYQDNITVTFSPCAGINSALNNVNMNVYPNPNNGEFTLNINTTDINELDVKVMNTQGQVVYAKNNYSNVTNINDKIDLSNNANGIYFIVITTNKGIVTHKLVIQ